MASLSHQGQSHTGIHSHRGSQAAKGPRWAGIPGIPRGFRLPLFGTLKFVILGLVAIVTLYKQIEGRPAKLLRYLPACGQASFDTPAAHTRESLLSVTTAVLEAANATYFVIPDGAITPRRPQHETTASVFHSHILSVLGHAKNTFSFSPWARGATIGVISADSLRVLLAVSALPAASHDGGHAAAAYVETHAGVRVHAGVGGAHGRWDYAEPYVDLVWFRAVDGLLRSGCCDCGAVAIGACSKRMCGCLACTYVLGDVLPTRRAWIRGVERYVDLPRLADVERVDGV